MANQGQEDISDAKMVGKAGSIMTTYCQSRERLIDEA
jgi:hypothetical protein